MVRRFLVILLVVLMIPLVSGFSVSPSRVNLDYDNGLVFSDNITVEHEGELDVSIRQEGPLTKYMKIDKEFIRFGNESLYELEIDLSIPVAAKLEPGVNEQKILFIAQPKIMRKQTLVVPSIIAQIRVHVPYPDKYVEPAISLYTDDNGFSATTVLFNRGKEIKSGNLKTIILGKSGVVERLISEEFSIPEKGKEKIVQSAKMEKGVYDMKMTVLYDGNQRVVERKFAVGEKKIRIVNVSHSSASENVIVFGVTLENKWGDVVEGVEVNADISRKGKLVETIRSSPVNVYPDDKSKVGLFRKNNKAGESDVN